MEIYHKYFIQHMIKKGIQTLDNAVEFCQRASKGVIPDVPKFKIMLVEINRQISKQSFKIIISTCEVLGKEMVIFLNTKNDDISKLQLGFNALELEYFHILLQELVNSASHRLSYAAALNCTSNLTSRLSRDDGQKALNKWFKGGYFIKVADYIYLGSRTILEFTSYLKAHCPQQICYLCSELLFTGRQCEQCDTIFHAHCLDKYFERQASCPNCENQWIEATEEASSEYQQHVQADDTQEDEDESSAFQEHTNVQDQDSIYDDPQPSTSWDRAYEHDRSGTRSSNRKRKATKN